MCCVGFAFFLFLGMCLEKRAFYRIISGLHASINIHLTATYLLKGLYGAISYVIAGIVFPNSWIERYQKFMLHYFF